MECPNKYLCLTSSRKWRLNKCLSGQRVKLTYYQLGGKALKIRGRIHAISGPFIRLFNAKITGKIITKDGEGFFNFFVANVKCDRGGSQWHKELLLKRKYCRFIEKPIFCSKMAIQGAKEVAGNGTLSEIP